MKRTTSERKPGQKCYSRMGLRKLLSGFLGSVMVRLVLNFSVFI
jgi:hypothetical protein